MPMWDRMRDRVPTSVDRMVIMMISVLTACAIAGEFDSLKVSNLQHLFPTHTHYISFQREKVMQGTTPASDLYFWGQIQLTHT